MSFLNHGLKKNTSTISIANSLKNVFNVEIFANGTLKNTGHWMVLEMQIFIFFNPATINGL